MSWGEKLRVCGGKQSRFWIYFRLDLISDSFLLFSQVPMGIYLEAAHAVSLGKNPESKSHAVYLSTDDPEAVHIARAWTKGILQLPP